MKNNYFDQISQLNSLFASIDRDAVSSALSVANSAEISYAHPLADSISLSRAGLDKAVAFLGTGAGLSAAFEQPEWFVRLQKSIDLVNGGAAAEASNRLIRDAVLLKTNHIDELWNKSIMSVKTLIEEPSALTAIEAELGAVRTAVSAYTGLLSSAFDLFDISQIEREISFAQTYDNEIDNDALIGAAETVLSAEGDMDIDIAASAIANEYELRRSGSADADESSSLNKRLDIEQIKKWLIVFVKVVYAFLTLYFGISSVNISIDHSFNSVKEVNNYYIVSAGLDADDINDMGYRIVNRDCCPRVKRKIHSYVTGRLTAGQAVRVLDKRKKWVQVEWEDTDGELCFGWVQNYMLNKFKE